MFKIFAETHKIIVNNLYDNIYENYDLKLDKKKLEWGSIAPDILPHYRFIRHYKDESLNFISKEIMKVIFISRFLDFTGLEDPIAMKLLSKRIGIISHYLSDYVCLPHSSRWTFFGSMKKHIKYEKELEVYAAKHDYKSNKISVDDLNIYDIGPRELQATIKKYINDVVEEYTLKENFSRDLDFAVSINTKMTKFILETIAAYSEELQGHFAY